MMDTWTIEQSGFAEEALNIHMESLFTLGNGYLGIRGDSQLSDFVFQKGTYINGFYESGPITYGEKAYGYAERWQTIIPLPEAKDLMIFIDGVELFTEKGKFEKRSRILNLKESHSLWELVWIDENGQKYKGTVKTIVPFGSRGAMICKWDITLPLEGSDIVIKSPLIYESEGAGDRDDPRLPEHFDGSTLKLKTKKLPDKRHLLSMETEGSRLYMSCSMDHRHSGLHEAKTSIRESEAGLLETVTAQAEKKISIIKTVSYSYGAKIKNDEVDHLVLKELDMLKKDSFDDVEINQKDYMVNFWYRSDVKIKGDDEAQLSLRYNLFQLLQSTGRDGKRSIAAKGLSGSGYEGHYFWDAETYVLPYFIYTNPAIARSMLSYRISIVNAAKKRAEHLGHQGILFPWRTINGEESSAYFPAGTAQFHINSDIALGLVRYLEVTGDVSILAEGGDQILAGTARFWADLGTSVSGRGFCFNTVTGPDEYTALVDNNYYTNLSAKKNLSAASQWLKGIAADDELDEWKNKSDDVYLPPIGSVTPQDDSFLNKEPWDFLSTPDDKYPLLLNFHPLNIYRKKVLKQADVIMAQTLFPSELPLEQIKLNFDYYEQLTTRDSSLSACAQGINAFWIGYDDLAWEYFQETLHTDRKDLHGNVSHGLHTASMGGSYLMVVKGFLGLENIHGTVGFNPRLPEQLNNLSLKISVGKKLLQIDMSQSLIQYKSLNSDLVIYHSGERIELKKEEQKSKRTLLKKKQDYTLFRPRS